MCIYIYIERERCIYIKGTATRGSEDSARNDANSGLAYPSKPCPFLLASCPVFPTRLPSGTERTAMTAAGVAHNFLNQARLL